MATIRIIMKSSVLALAVCVLITSGALAAPRDGKGGGKPQPSPAGLTPRLYGPDGEVARVWVQSVSPGVRGILLAEPGLNVAFTLQMVSDGSGGYRQISMPESYRESFYETDDCTGPAYVAAGSYPESLFPDPITGLVPAVFVPAEDLVVATGDPITVTALSFFNPLYTYPCMPSRWWGGGSSELFYETRVVLPAAELQGPWELRFD